MAKKKVEDAAEAKGGKGKRNKITPADAARRLAANMEEVTVREPGRGLWCVTVGCRCVVLSCVAVGCWLL